MSARANVALAASLAAFALSAVAIVRGAPDAAMAPERPTAAMITPDAVRAALLERPEILAETAQALRAKQDEAERKGSVAQVEANREALFGVDGPVIGNPKGTRVVVEFFDYQCGYCRSAQPQLMEAASADGELKIMLRELPILGPASVLAAKAALAAGMQDLYLPMHDALLAQSMPLDEEKILEAARSAGADVERLRADMESEAVATELAEGARLARALGISGTPSFAALGAGVLNGFGDLERFEAFLEAAEAP